MVAKFQIILSQDTVIKSFCIGLLSEDEVEKDKNYYLSKRYIEKDENYLRHKKFNIIIIYEKVKNLSSSKYKHLCLKSTYERYIKGYEQF